MHLNFCLALLVPLLLVDTLYAHPVVVGTNYDANKKDWCMSRNLACIEGDTRIVATFNNVHSQPGCQERCSQFDNCEWWTWYEADDPTYTMTCFLFDLCTYQNASCRYCYTGPRCMDPDDPVTSVLIGQVKQVETLMEDNPSIGVVKDFPLPLYNPSVATIGGRIYVCGGAIESEKGLLEPIDSCFTYNLVKFQWSPLQKSLPGGNLTKATGNGAYGEVYIIGGQDANGTALNTVQIYNDDTEEWRLGPAMLHSWSGHCSMRFWDAIYVVGSESGIILLIDKLNITTGQWSTISPKNKDGPVARSDFACVLNGDTIFVSGGTNNEHEVLDAFDAFNLTSLAWKSMVAMNSSRCGHSMVMYKGQPTVIGGQNGKQDYLKDIESFEDDNSWVLLPEQLGQSRKDFSVTQVSQSLLPYPSLRKRDPNRTVNVK